MTEKILKIFSDFFDSFINSLPNLLIAVLFIFLFYIIGRLVFSAFKKAFVSRSEDPFAIIFAGKMIKWTLYVIGIIIAMNVMGFSGIANSLLTGAGISALIVGFAFKDIFENFLSGIMLAINRPFNTGNVIEINGFKGTVKGLDLRTTHIRNVEGKDIFIPNATMVKGVLINYTKDGYLRLDFDIGMDVPADLKKVKSLILNYLSTQPEILKKPEPNVISTQFGSHTVDLKVLFWVNILKDKNSAPSYLGSVIKSKVIQDVKDLIIEHNFNMPNPIIEYKMYEPDKAIKLKIES